ncbi:hypothetical protein [Kitasatospora sp. HPMI-4]|uniref:hypothetical protein n=1 Tax=Kitasatospora sp. HPMI-4 TaxID=3448443 RepID=UPI003F1CD07E
MTEPSKEELLAEAEAATARFRQGLPASRAVTTTGELAAILAALPGDTPLFLSEHAVSRPGPIEDAVHSVVAHLTPCAEPVAPDNPDGTHRMRPALGLTTVVAEHRQDAGAEFDRGGLEPEGPLARAEERLTSSGDLDGGITDVARAIETLVEQLREGAGFIPSDSDAHGTVMVEMSRLLQAAERLRKVAPDAQKASEK